MGKKKTGGEKVRFTNHRRGPVGSDFLGIFYDTPNGQSRPGFELTPEQIEEFRTSGSVLRQIDINNISKSTVIATETPTDLHTETTEKSMV